MVWLLRKVTELPLGKRVLNYGCMGSDVKELQELLCQTGFYFGEKDGIFGLLTKEAVVFFQKTFNLRVDGVAGREVLNVLQKVLRGAGRIIYRIKKYEDLDTISQKFVVKKSAWRRIPGQGNPHQKIYPGMRVLLHEKVLFCWDSFEVKPGSFTVTGFIHSTYRIERDGKLVQEIKDQKDQSEFNLIGATSEDWAQLISSPKIWVKLVEDLTKLKGTKFGFDLRKAPLDKIIHWLNFLKYLSRNLGLKEFPLLVLPFLTVMKKLENQLYWLNLPFLSNIAKYLMIEPAYNLDSPVAFEVSANSFYRDLKQLSKLGLTGKTLLICQSGGWDWNLEQNQYQNISYKVARLVRAQNFYAAQYFFGSKFTRLDYLKRNKHHCLVYRDEEGWRDFFAVIIKMNLPGVVIRDFNDFGRMGPEMITSSFSVLTNEKLQLL